jgi:hypothetical protein
MADSVYSSSNLFKEVAEIKGVSPILQDLFFFEGERRVAHESKVFTVSDHWKARPNAI